MHHLAAHLRHRTPNWVSGVALANGLYFDSIFLHCGEKTNKVGAVKDLLWCSCGVVAGLANKELDFSDSEGVLLCVGSFFSVITRNHE